MESNTDSEGTIHLPEESWLLENLFRFVYPCFVLSIIDFEYSVVEALGDASEKYEVANGIILCWMYIQ
jgi:hypothetical protein